MSTRYFHASAAYTSGPYKNMWSEHYLSSCQKDSSGRSKEERFLHIQSTIYEDPYCRDFDKGLPVRLRRWLKTQRHGSSLG